MEAGGISAVAETLGSSTPAVGRRVKAMERALALGLPIAAAAFPSDRRGRSITNIVSPFSKSCGTPKPKCDCKRLAPTFDRKPDRLDALPHGGPRGAAHGPRAVRRSRRKGATRPGQAQGRQAYASRWRKGALRETGVAQAARFLRPAAATRISGDAIRLRPFHTAESELARRRGVRLTLARRPGEVFSSRLPTLAWAA
jgi:hypothetical protein